MQNNENSLSRGIRAVISGSKGGGTQRKSVESPDSLFSIAQARIIDIVSEGEIEGFVHGADFLRDCYFDETPVQNEDGTQNFKSFQVDARTGTQDQTYIPGFPAVENELSLGIPLLYNSPWTRSFTNKQLSAVRVRIGVAALNSGDPDTGDIKGGSVSYAIDVATDGGAFVEVCRSAMTGKASNPYERGHRIELPTSTVSGWVVRVRRLTPESTSQWETNATSMVSVTEIIDGKFRYPMSALVGVQIDASQFSSIPTRAYHLKGRKIKVPANYDPVTRTYATTGTGTSGGSWNGTFKTVYSNNPAWVFYDMTTHKRYGLGRLVDELLIDKWSLYSIGQYCDEMVSDGFGGTEPRMTCNLYLQSAQDAWKVVGDLSSIFRGICYWAGGSIVPVADRPSDPVYTYTNANVVEGLFRYESTSRRARHTAVIVSYNDMSDFGRLKSDYYDDPEGIARFGFQLAEIVALGCTSRGQAQRFAKWLLYSEKLLTNTVSFTVGVDGTFASPGQIVRVADAFRAGRRIGGRIASATASQIVLDALPTPAPMAGDTAIATLPSGITESRTISSVVGNGINVSVPWSAVPVAESVWAVESTDLSTQLFRILGCKENEEDGTHSIIAMQHNASIFDAVDFGEAISVPPISVVPSPNQMRPGAITITSVERAGEVIAIPLVMASWVPATGAVKYQIQWRKDSGEWTTPQIVNGTTADYQTPFPGIYEAKVSAVNALGVVSVPRFSDPFTLEDQTLTPGFVDALNADIAEALLTAENAQAVADGAIISFWQDSPPTIGSGAGEAKVGDIWFDTNDGNHIWRVVGGVWVDAQDDDLAQALAAATLAQATADGKVKTFFGATEPTAEAVGDLWFNTTTKKLFRWNGANWSDQISDVTLDQLGGSGVNILPEEYTRRINTDLPALVTSGVLVAAVADSTPSGYAFRFETTGTITSGDWAYFTPGTGVRNVVVQPGKYLFSYFARATAVGHQIQPRFVNNNGTQVIGQTRSLSAAYQRSTEVIEFVEPTAISANFFFYFNRSGVVGRQVFIDQIMLEPMIGRLVQASPWSPGTPSKMSYDAIAAASLALDTADGKIETYFQTTMPTGASLGDLWFDTGDGNKVWRHNGTTFVLAADDDMAQAIAAAAGAQGTADGKVTTFYKATAPTNADAPPAIGSLKVGDLWYDTVNSDLSRYSGSAWVKISDITVEKMAGSGANLMWEEYSILDKAQNLTGSTIPALYASGPTFESVADAGSINGFRYKFVSQSTNTSEYVGFGSSASDYPIYLAGGKKYLFSFYGSAPVNNSVAIWLRGPANFDSANFVVSNAGRARYSVVFDLTAAPDGYYRFGVWNNRGGVSGRILYMDGLMVEPMIGNKADPSPFSSGPSFRRTQIAIANAAFAQATADGKVELFRQATAPTATGIGDIWIDSDDGKMWTWNGSIWIYDPNDELGNAIDAAQSTANARNTTFYQTTAPTALAVGDLWYNRNTMELKRWSGSEWLNTSGAPSGGNGENMLSNPNFMSNAAGAVHNVPANVGDPLSDGWYCYQTSARADTDVRWQSSGMIRLRFYGTTALANGASVTISSRTLNNVSVEEGRTYKFTLEQSNTFSGTIPAGINLRTRITVRTFDNANAQISYAEVVTGSRVSGTYTGTYTVPAGSGVKSVSVQVELLCQNLSGASWTHTGIALDAYITKVSMVKVADLDNEVQDGTDYGRYSVDDRFFGGGKWRVGLRYAGSGHRIGDQRNLPQSIVNGLGSVKTTTALSATSAGAISVLAHTIRMGGASVSYNAVSNAITGRTVGVTYTVYCFDDGYTGGTKTWFASSASVDTVMNLGDGIVIAGFITIPSSGSSSGGGGGQNPGDCVDYDSVLPDGRLVRLLQPGDMVACIDVTKENPEIEMHPVRAIGFGQEYCYRLTSSGLVSVIQSESTPMNLPDGRVLRTPDMFGKPVLVNMNGELVWDIVADLERVGVRQVVKVDLGDRMFFAGTVARGTIATHNIIWKP